MRCRSDSSVEVSQCEVSLKSCHYECRSNPSVEVSQCEGVTEELSL